MSAMGVAAMMLIKKTGAESDNTSTTTTSGSSNNFGSMTAQDFLPFKDIKDGLIDLGNFEYRAILECRSINYDLKTNQEKSIIDASFQRFLDSLNFPITIHIQTRTIDNTSNLLELENDMIDVVKEYPQLFDYATKYLDEMASITETIGNDKQKRKYIIIPFSDSADLTYSTDEEKYEEALRGIFLRCQIVADGLSTMGINVKLMNSRDIAELIYSTYHRDNYSDINQILDGEYMSLIVDGKNSLTEMYGDRGLVWMISELENRLKSSVESQTLSEMEKRKTEAVLEKIIQLKRAVSK
jgi:hypothetical protein